MLISLNRNRRWKRGMEEADPKDAEKPVRVSETDLLLFRNRSKRKVTLKEMENKRSQEGGNN